jgi:hypothetical protein
MRISFISCVPRNYCDYLDTIMNIYWLVYSLGMVMKTYRFWSSNEDGLHD